MIRKSELWLVRLDGCWIWRIRETWICQGKSIALTAKSAITYASVTYLVLDEADRMLDQGFENDIRRIIAHCPDRTGGRQTVMCGFAFAFLIVLGTDY